MVRALAVVDEGVSAVLAEVAVRMCLGVVVAGVVQAIVIVEGEVSALELFGVDSKLVSVLESKSALAGVSHFDHLLW